MDKKGLEFEIEIDALGADGEGVGRIDGVAAFVKGALIGETIETTIFKDKKSYCFGNLLNVKTPSKDRTTPPCEAFGTCGGCSLQHLAYNGQLEYKTQKVFNAIKRIGGIDNAQVAPIIGAEQPLFYRNKGKFYFAKVDNKIVYGFYEQKSHKIAPIEKCYIEHEAMEEILQTIRGYVEDCGISCFDEVTKKGILRHVLIKVGVATNEIMVIFTIYEKILPHNDVIIKALSKINNVKSIFIGRNSDKNSSLVAQNPILVYGKSTITDYIGDLQFQISPNSFFQVNSVQTKKLYDKALEFAQPNKDDIIIDAYCGIGTISLTFAPQARHVYGIEISAQAIEDAQNNATLNNISNVTFLEGDSPVKIKEMAETITHSTILVLDPPRKGCAPEMLETILDILPNKIVYISCDPATLARDLKQICEKHYAIAKVQPVDCFPMTPHVETVVLLTRK